MATKYVEVVLLLFWFCNSLVLTAVTSKIWGPGLYPDKIITPARYFFVEVVDGNSKITNQSLESELTVKLVGITKQNKPCRIWTNILDIKDGTYIVRYKIYDICSSLHIDILYKSNHISDSPLHIKENVYPDDCDCPKGSLNDFINLWECGEIPVQIHSDLKLFPEIDWGVLREQIISTYDKPHSISLCHFVIKSNEIYRKCYGKYVGFKMFLDSILLSLKRKTNLPDTEFFINLGDWPLVVNDTMNDVFPIFSWCGSSDTFDIVMPTYDITESTLENMGRVMLDMLSVQGNSKLPWEGRMQKAFWRGRDSSRERLKLIEISRKYPDLFNTSLTNFFFFRDEEKIYGPKSEHVSFFSFFDYKYQLGLDGTVAAYRLPYLLAGGSLLFKQTSKYYEHFYKQLIPNEHYISIKRDLSDLVDKLKWALNNDDEAKRIAQNGQRFANKHLLPKDIFCYYAHLLNEFSARIKSNIEIREDMEQVHSNGKVTNCECHPSVKDEL